MSLFMLFQGVCHQILPPQLDMFPTIRISAAAEFESLLAENRWICGRLSSEHCSVCCTPCKRHWNLSETRKLMTFQNEINFKLHTCHSSIFFENTWITEGLACANVAKSATKKKLQQQLTWSVYIAAAFQRWTTTGVCWRFPMMMASTSGYAIDSLVVWEGISCFKRWFNICTVCLYIYINIYIFSSIYIPIISIISIKQQAYQSKIWI